MRPLIFLLLTGLFLPCLSIGQNSERISFDPSDSASGYYLAIPPKSNQIKGVILLLTSFSSPADLLSETKLHNVACNNDLLTVFAPMKQKLYADTFAVNRINSLVKDIIQRFHADTSKFVLAGYDDAGSIALRYTELTYQYSSYPIRPKAVFGIDPSVDLFGLWHRSERQIKTNYWPGAVGDAHYYLRSMTQENGTIYNNRKRYLELSPFFSESDSPGNEQFLKDVPVRLYYDTDIDWQLKSRRNSFYDIKILDGSELIKRLLLLGNERAELMPAKEPGMRSNGLRNPNSLSIVDEVECIQWIKRCLDIFDPATWSPPYRLDVPEGWEVERFSLPAQFAPEMTFKGIEELRFTPGWGDSTSTEYWSYAYLWWLNKPSGIDAQSLKSNLQALYTGLVGTNITSRQIPLSKQVPTEVTVEKIKTNTGDVQTFQGRARMLDYMTQKPMTLNLIFHVKNCLKENTVAVLVGVSPKSPNDPIWKTLNQLNETFECSK